MVIKPRVSESSSEPGGTRDTFALVPRFRQASGAPASQSLSRGFIPVAEAAPNPKDWSPEGDRNKAPGKRVFERARGNPRVRETRPEPDSRGNLIGEYGRLTA
jgi:hypothetical protein